MDIIFLTNQLDELIDTYSSMRGKSQNNDLSDLPKHLRQGLITRTVAAINRISGSNSTYSKEVTRIIELQPYLNAHTTSIIGVATALRDDIKAGYIKSLIELVHADVFSDFLEMAQHLCDTNYKDPSAVLAGSTLESHLKKLAIKNEVPIDIAGVPVKADKLNADLAKANIYNILDQKSITAWLDLRNKAAHGKYDEYDINQVKLLIAGIRDFIARVTA